MLQIQGTSRVIDENRPYVVLNAESLEAPLRIGRIVYPIGIQDHEEPGTHGTEGYITINPYEVHSEGVFIPDSKLTKFSTIGKKISTGVISLDELVSKVGPKFGITKITDNSYPNAVVLQLADRYIADQVPDSVKNELGNVRATSYDRGLYEREIIFDSQERLIQALRSAMRPFELESSKVISIEQQIERDGSATGNFRGDPYKETPLSGAVFYVRKQGDAYLLKFHQETMDDQPEQRLAEQSGKPRALHGVFSNHTLTRIDKDWVGVDVDKAFNGGPLAYAFLSELTRQASGQIPYDQAFRVVVDDLDVGICVNFSSDGHFLRGRHYRDGNKIFMIVEHYKRRQRYPHSKAEIPSNGNLTLSLRPLLPMLTENDKAKLIKVRDRLSELVQTNLS